MIRAAALSFAALLTGTAAAQDGAGGLLGRQVTFGTLTYDVREQPIYVGDRHIATVTGSVEYGLGPEGVQNGFDVVSAIVDIADDSVAITYPVGITGQFPDTGFNGYVLDFLTDCVLFRSAMIDPERNTGVLEPEDVWTEGAKLYVNVGGAEYAPDITFAVRLDVIDCPLG